MSKYATALEKGLPQVELIGAAADPPVVAGGMERRPYAELATRLFSGPGARSVVGFISARRGEGVTHVVRDLATELARTGANVTALDGSLRHLQIPGAGVTPFDGARPHILGVPLTGEPATAPALLAGLRTRFDRILLDCGSLQASVDPLRLIPAADGIVLVVEAGGTTKEQIERAAQVIREAGGNLLGAVMNKRRYPVPAWLYRLL